MTPRLEVSGLSVGFHGGSTVVKNVDLTVLPGETLALMGASGSGKSTVCTALLGLLPSDASVRSSAALFDGSPMFDGSGRPVRGLAGARIGAVFQDPRASLTPHLTVLGHFRDLAAAAAVRGVVREAVDERAARLLTELAVLPPPSRLRLYPHELSGGLAQRVALALALFFEPSLLIADEPTTALDPTVQAGLLRLLRRASINRGTSVLLVTHDFGVAAGLADRVAVMEEGRIVECATTAKIASNPRSSAARALIEAACDPAVARFRDAAAEGRS